MMVLKIVDCVVFYVLIVWSMHEKYTVRGIRIRKPHIHAVLVDGH